jgi:hypothetical protein
MPDVIESVERAFGRLYTAFIMRDLTFFISGAIVTVVVAPSALERLTDILSLSPKFQWFSILAFLAISYVLGIVLQEAVRIFMEPLSREYVKRRMKYAESKDELVVRLEKIIKEGCSDHTIRGIERILFLKQVGGTLFSALLAILVIFAIRCRINGLPTEGWLTGIGALLLCGWIYMDKSLQQEKILSSLESNGNSEDKGSA